MPGRRCSPIGFTLRVKGLCTNCQSDGQDAVKRSSVGRPVAEKVQQLIVIEDVLPVLRRARLSLRPDEFKPVRGSAILPSSHASDQIERIGVDFSVAQNLFL
jgi:hypothetical protein